MISMMSSDLCVVLVQLSSYTSFTRVSICVLSGLYILCTWHDCKLSLAGMVVALRGLMPVLIMLRAHDAPARRAALILRLVRT